MYQTYVATFIAAALYAVFLQLLGKAYEPRWTWLTVVVGVGLVMLGAAARIRFLPLPALAGADLAWWVWWQVAWHFCTGGAPIIVWQIWQERRMLIDALQYRSKDTSQ